MTPSQKDKREEIVLSMKKDKEELKKKYGSEWKDAMYAIATKKAMKESLEDDIKKKVKGKKTEVVIDPEPDEVK